MPNQLPTGDLIANISSELADNNAGLISAYDVRHNLEDTVFSINAIVASGDTEVEFPFFNAVKFSIADSSSPSAGADHGDAVVESGIFFPNCDDVAKQTQRQTEPWLGDAGINHDNLQNLGNDTHTQYYNLLGVDTVGRSSALQGNMATNNLAKENWINCSGIENVGIKFVQTSSDAVEQEIHVSGLRRFVEDNSIQATAKGVAKAWLRFDASGVYDGVDNLPVVKSWYNISGVKRDAPGKFTITFTPGIWENNDYTAIGVANGRNDEDDTGDFDINTVGIVARTGVDSDPTGRTCEVSVINLAGQYVDAELIDLVFYGYNANETSGVVPTMEKDPGYSE